MNRLLNMHVAKLIAAGTAICFLLIHITLFVIFFRCGVTPMAYFNIFSMCFYTAMLYVIYREKMQLFVVGTFLEVLLHMTLAVVFVGWSAGFQATLIGINLLVFFAEYVARILKIKYVPSLPMTFLCMCCYIGSYIYTYFVPAPYPLPDGVCFCLQIWWALVVFIITITCMYGFVWLTFHSEELLSDQVVKDKLTGLPNRYYLSDFLNKQTEKEGLKDCWLAMADIDDFKLINDNYGHIFGDYVLKSIASIIREVFVTEEYCRWGGEEFLIVGHCDSAHPAEEILETFRQAVQSYSFSYRGQNIHLTITVGVEAYHEGDSIDEWVNLADKKLYAGKCSGKNQVVS